MAETSMLFTLVLSNNAKALIAGLNCICGVKRANKGMIVVPTPLAACIKPPSQLIRTSEFLII